MDDLRQRTESGQQEQLKALEKLAQQRVAEETDMRKADEAKAQYLLQVQRQLQESEAQARQAELRKTHEVDAARIRAGYEAELKQLQDKCEREQAESAQAVKEQEEKIRRFQVAQDQLHHLAHARSQPITPPVPVETPKVIPRVRDASDPLAAQVAQLVQIVQQLQNNQAHIASTETMHRTDKSQKIAQDGRTPVKPRSTIPTKTDGRKKRTVKSGGKGDDGYDSDDSSSSDSSQDELEGQFSTASQPKQADTGTGTRVVVQAMIPHDALEKFDERAALEDRVNWWERFMYYATMAPWDETTRIVQLRMRLTGALKDWCAQLPDTTRSDWKRFSHVFKKEWCRSVGSRAERYYNAEIREAETPRMFLYRINRAAKRASIAYEKPTADREAHIRRFIKALGNSRLRTTLQGQRFDTLSKLEETLKHIEALQQDENRDNPDHQQKRRSPQNLQFGRFKPPQRRAEARAFVADGVSSSPSQRRYVHFEDEQNSDKEYESESPQAQSEGSGITNNSPTITGSTEVIADPSRLDAVTEEDVFRVAEQLAWKPRPGTQPYGGASQNQAKCEQCGSPRHATEKCWSGLICGRCHE
ncbi:hypothetical protein PR003_g25556 [Phytophthora rubi]|uniref:Retrotransposon gag domain-containing protein n=1 Tax=Phytophthora rubi TaxID=129364 RepID=A0A6A4CH55_9STRA|nr:hypothetical protein PR003_g25556 [Phytophthora rubi]